MHENQRIVNDMIAMAKDTLNNLNDKHFSMDEVWDFIEDVIKASGKEDKVDKVFEEWSKK